MGTRAQTTPSDELRAGQRERSPIPRRPLLTSGFEPIRKEECTKLIEAGIVGRIAYVGADGLVLIPVNYCTLGALIAFRTAADSTVAQFNLAPIAFELDFRGEGTRDRWSILVNGMVRPATGREADAVRNRVEPWPGGVRESVMVIEPHRITGRRTGRDVERPNVVGRDLWPGVRAQTDLPPAHVRCEPAPEGRRAPGRTTGRNRS